MPNPLSPNDRYVAIARSYDHFKVWARQYGVSAVNFRYASELRAVEGLTYNLVIFPGHRFDLDQLQVLVERATRVYTVNELYPVAEMGKIVKWVKFNGK